MSTTQNIIPDVGRFQAVIKSLEQFDNIEVLPVVKALLAPTEREQCFVAAYYRTVAHARTLLIFAEPAHFQAIAMIARTLYELAIDIRLIDKVPDAIQKLYAFCDSERLRVARNVVALAASGKIADDVSVQIAYIANKGATIDAQHQVFWPGTNKVAHWSAMNLRDRAKKLGSPYDVAYDQSYAELSWDVHPGLAGVLNLDSSVFPAKCGLAFKFAIDWYMNILRAVAHELKIDKGVEKFDDKLKLAMYLPMTDSPEQAAQLRKATIG